MAYIPSTLLHNAGMYNSQCSIPTAETVLCICQKNQKSTHTFQ